MKGGTRERILERERCFWLSHSFWLCWKSPSVNVTKDLDLELDIDLGQLDVSRVEELVWMITTSTWRATRMNRTKIRMARIATMKNTTATTTPTNLVVNLLNLPLLIHNVLLHNVLLHHVLLPLLHQLLWNQIFLQMVKNPVWWCDRLNRRIYWLFRLIWNVFYIFELIDFTLILIIIYQFVEISDQNAIFHIKVLCKVFDSNPM